MVSTMTTMRGFLHLARRAARSFGGTGARHALAVITAKWINKTNSGSAQLLFAPGPLTCTNLWGGWGSNPRPRDYESRALTTELPPRKRGL